MKNQLILFLTLLMIATTMAYGQPLKNTAIDIDGNIYHTVKIGTQTWMVENLKVTHYRNGDAVLKVTDDEKWSELKEGAYCNYSNNDSNSLKYGHLYNWYTIEKNSKICPEGWHIPKTDEWIALYNYFGCNSGYCDLLLDSGEILEHNQIKTKKSDFVGLFAGYRALSGSYSGKGCELYFWTATNYREQGIRCIQMCYCGEADEWDSSHNALNQPCGSQNGFSVRCLKDD